MENAKVIKIRKLRLRKRFDYNELRKVIKSLRNEGKIKKIDLRSSKRVLLDVYNAYVERNNKLYNNIKKHQKALQLKRNKKVYSVHIDARIKTYYPKYKKSYVDTAPLEFTFKARNANALQSMIQQKLNERYPYSDSEREVSLESFKYIVKDEGVNQVKSQDVPMKRATPFQVSFLKYSNEIDPISYEDHQGECVIKMLHEYFNIARRETITKPMATYYKQLYNKEWKPQCGITGAMILKFCKSKNISCLGLDQRSNMFVKNVADKRRGRKYKKSLIFYMCVGHMYIITNKDALRSLSITYANGNSTFKSSLEVMESDVLSKKTYYDEMPMKECIDLPQNSVVIFNKPNLNEELQTYFNLTNDIPKFKFKTITSIDKIYLPNQITLLCSGVYEDNMDWKTIRGICEQQQIEFRNQGIGTLLKNLQDKHYTSHRKKFTKEERDEIKDAQNALCNDCKEELKSFHIDHITPLSSGGTNDKHNLQALCQSCHIEKCKRENEACEYIKHDKFISAFNIQAIELIKSSYFHKVQFSQTLDAFNELKHNPEQLLTNFKQVNSIDINKCRRNILLHYGEAFCKYSVMDNIQEFDGNLSTGFYYLETENKFPLRGHGFYSLPMIQYCLKHQIIAMEDIKLQFKPSMTIKHDEFKPFVDYILNAFSNYPKAQKIAINSLIGMFGRKNGSFIETMMCDKHNLDDIGHCYEVLHSPYSVNICDQITAINSKKCIHKIENHYPIYAQVLDCEAIELHKMCRMIENIGGIPLEIKTDAVNYLEPHDNNVKIDDKFWDKEQTIQKYKFETPRQLKGSISWMNTRELEWKPHEYKHLYPSSDCEYTSKSILEKNEGCLILGCAGVGKTYLVNTMIKQLEEQGKSYKRLAPTNKSALLIEGQTLDKFSYGILNSNTALKKLKNIDYFFVDEISMVREIFYQVLISIKQYNPNAKFIVVGDFGQLPPVNDRIHCNYENSRCLWELVDGNKMELTECKRSDDRLYNICLKVRNNKSITRELFKFKEPTYKNICFTNKTRKIVNEMCIKRYHQQHPRNKRIMIEELSYDKNSQAYELMEGMPIIARVNNKQLNIVNNEAFIVSKILKNKIIVKNTMNEEVEVSIEKFNRVFYIAFCITTHKSQGETIDEKYTIYEWDKMDTKLKYVAISRGKEISNIQIF